MNQSEPPNFGDIYESKGNKRTGQGLFDSGVESEKSIDRSRDIKKDLNSIINKSQTNSTTNIDKSKLPPSNNRKADKQGT